MAPFALQIAFALAEAVGVVVDLEAVLFGFPLDLHIHRHHVVVQRFPGTEGIIPAPESTHSKKRHRRLQMAFVADVVPKVRREPRGVDDGASQQGEIHRLLHPRPYVVGARAVAALAAGSFRKLLREGLGSPIEIASFRYFRIAVVAEHALPAHPAGQARMAVVLIARRHPPAVGLGIPGQGKLVELSAGGIVEIGAGAGAGA